MKTGGRQATSDKDGVSLVDIKAALDLIYDAVDELEMKADNVILNTDQIDLNTDQIEAKLEDVKALISDSNLFLAAIDDNTDTLETELIAANLSLAEIIIDLEAIDSNTTNLEARLDSVITALGTVNTNLSDIKVTQATIIANQGTDGATPPAIAGTGIRGWLRGIYESVQNLLNFSFTGSSLNVNVTNQLDLSAIETLLTNIKSDTAAIDANTDLVETKLDSIISEIQTNGTTNNANLLNVILELQDIDANTDGLEAQLTSIITNTGLAATEAKQDVQIANQGTDGATPPTIAGTGIRGWLRGIYDRLANITSLTFTGGDLNVNASVSIDAASLIFGTTANLGIAANFSSGVLSLVGKTQVETRVLADVDGTINIFFYEDAAGTDLVRTLTIPYIGGSGFQYFAAPAFSNYVTYEYLNGAVAQTDFLYETKVTTTAINGQIVRLDGTIVESMVAPITRSIFTGQDKQGTYRNAIVTPSRNLGVSIIDSETGSVNVVDANGAVKVGVATNILGTAFGDASPNDGQWTTIGTGSGVRNDIAGAISLETGTTADSTLSFQSVNIARFLAANFNICHIGLNLSDVTELDCIRTWGAYNPQDPSINGVFFRLDETGTMCVGYVKGGVETIVLQNDWNGVSKDNFILDEQTRVYEFQYNAGSIRYFQNANLLHTVTSFVETYAELYNFKLALDVRNVNGNTTNNFIQSRALATYRVGLEHGATQSLVFPSGVTTVKAGAGFVKSVQLTRTGGGGGSVASVDVYDSLVASGRHIGAVRIENNENSAITLDSTFTNGLTIDVSSGGTTLCTVNYE